MNLSNLTKKEIQDKAAELHQSKKDLLNFYVEVGKLDRLKMTQVECDNANKLSVFDKIFNKRKKAIRESVNFIKNNTGKTPKEIKKEYAFLSSSYNICYEFINDFKIKAQNEKNNLVTINP